MKLLFYLLLYFIIPAILIGIGDGLSEPSERLNLETDEDAEFVFVFMIFWPIFIGMGIVFGVYWLCTNGVIWVGKRISGKLKNKKVEQTAKDPKTSNQKNRRIKLNL